jgi:hypothetical protein
MASGNHPTVLAAYVEAQGLSWQGLSREIRQETGVVISGEQLSRLGRGQSQAPRTDTRRAIEETLDMKLSDLLKPPPPGGVVLSEFSGAVDSHPSVQEQLMSAADRASRFHRSLMNQVDTVELAEGLRDVATAYPRQPLHIVLPSIISTQEGLFELLERPTDPRTGAELYFLAGVSSGLLAKASHDSMQPLAAKAQARTARMCAQAAGHTGLMAWADGIASLVSYWAGQPGEALRSAQRGLTSNANSSNLPWLHYLAARAHAAMGNAEGALEAIRAGEESWSRVQHDELDELGGLATFTQLRGDYYAADALVELPDQHPLAVDYSQRAVAGYANTSAPDWAFGDSAGSSAALARARIADGSVDGAGEVIRPVLELPVDQRINGVIKCVSAVHRELRAVDASEASDLRDQIEAFTELPMKGLSQ